MEAIVVTGPKEFEYRDNYPVPVPGDDEVRLRVLAAGICGTDVHITRGDESLMGMLKTPVVLGHEFCGEIDAMGKNVRGLKVRDYVSSEMHLVCHHCPACREKKYHACQFTKVQGIHLDGAFASYVIVPAWNVVKLPKLIPVKVAAIMDALGNAVHTTCKSEVRDRTVSIIGYGPIGAMAAEVARFLNAQHIYVVDISERALTRAERWKNICDTDNRVTLINSSVVDAPEYIRELTKGGTDVSLEFSGSPEGINTALDVTRSAGDVSLLGIPAHNDVVINNYGNNIIWKGLTLHGIIGREVFKTWDTMINLLVNGLDVTPIITGEYALKDFSLGVERFGKGEEQKVVLFPQQ